VSNILQRLKLQNAAWEGVKHINLSGNLLTERGVKAECLSVKSSWYMKDHERIYCI